MEQYYVIKGGIPLVGEVEIGGAKNAALAILAAAIMADETVTIDNLPNVRDMGPESGSFAWNTNISKKYVHLITFWAPCSENIIMPR